VGDEEAHEFPEELLGPFKEVAKHFKVVPPTPGLHVVIASPFDREHLVCELWDGGEHLGELHQEFGARTLEIYPRREGQPWVFPLAEFIGILQHADHWLGSGVPVEGCSFCPSKGKS
jgi:hypothetical protein